MYNHDERTMCDVLEAVVNWCKEHGAYSGESIMQSAGLSPTSASLAALRAGAYGPQLTAAGLLADIVDDILEMALEDCPK